MHHTEICPSSSLSLTLPRTGRRRLRLVRRREHTHTLLPWLLLLLLLGANECHSTVCEVGRQDTQTDGDGDGGRLSLCCVLCCGRWGWSGASLLGYSRWRGVLSHGVGSKEGAWMCSSPFLFWGPCSHRSFVHQVPSVDCRRRRLLFLSWAFLSCPVRSLHFGVGTM